MGLNSNAQLDRELLLHVQRPTTQSRSEIDCLPRKVKRETLQFGCGIIVCESLFVFGSTSDINPKIAKERRDL